MTEPAHILEPVNEVDDDPHGVFQASESAIAAMARKTLLRAGIYTPTAKHITDAREFARIEYQAQAQHAMRTGSVRP
jgi:hypothetical protein